MKFLLGGEKTLGSTLFLYGFEVETGKSVQFAEPCLFCERFILNAGIKEVKSFVDFESIEGEENIAKLGFSSSPVIESDGKYYVGGAECMKFIQSLK